MACLEARIDADLACGRHDDLIGELEALVARQPAAGAAARSAGARPLPRRAPRRRARPLRRLSRGTRRDGSGSTLLREMRELERRVLRQDPALDLDRDRRRRAGRSAGRWSVRLERRRLDRLPGRRRRPARHRARPRLGLQLPRRRGSDPQIASFYRRLAASRSVDPVRQARHGSVRSRARHRPRSRSGWTTSARSWTRSARERAPLLGISEGGPMVALFAATYPERTIGLVRMGAFARRMWAPDYPDRRVGRRAAVGSAPPGGVGRDRLRAAASWPSGRPRSARDDAPSRGTPPTSSAARARRAVASSAG